MKKWQKISGCIIFTALALYDMLMWAVAYVDAKYIIEPNGPNFLVECVYMRFDIFSVMLWLNYIMALCLFICLWRKGDKR